MVELYLRRQHSDPGTVKVSSMPEFVSAGSVSSRDGLQSLENVRRSEQLAVRRQP